MKKAIIFICVITTAITLNSCKRKQYYACCDSGHAHWEGKKYDTGGSGDLRLERENHDKNIHGGVATAQTCFN